MDKPDKEEPDDRASSFRLEITFAVGYRRQRARLAGVWEARLTTLALLVAGVLVVLIFLISVFRLSLP